MHTQNLNVDALLIMQNKFAIIWNENQRANDTAWKHSPITDKRFAQFLTVTHVKLNMVKGRS